MDITANKLKLLKVCSLCFTQIYQGCHHNCSQYRYCHKKLYNIEKLVGSPTTSERLAAKAINRCDSDAGLQTYGRKLKLLDSSSSVKRKLFSLDDMCIIRKDLSLSAREALCLVQDLHKAADCKPRHVIEPSFKK